MKNKRFNHDYFEKVTEYLKTKDNTMEEAHKTFDADYRRWLRKNNIKLYRGCDQQSLAPTIAVILSIALATLILLFALSCNEVFASEYSDSEIVEAIYIIEGSEKAKKPFGILSIPCHTYDECKRICENTVRNNRKRYARYGHKEYSSYLEFLASRYAPIGVANDPTGLNKNWLPNLKSVLAKNRRSR